MNDASLIFLILGVIYLLDCLHLVNRNAVVFSSWIGTNFKATFAGIVVGTRSSGVMVSPLLPPLGITYIAQPLPVSFSPTGACSFITQALTPAGRPSQVTRVVRYDEITRLACEGKEVLINGDLFVKCRSPRMARHITEAIRRLVKAEPAARERLVKQLAVESFDVNAVRAAVESFRASAKWLRGACNLLWILMFVVLPVLMFGLKVWFLVLPLVGLLLVLHGVVVGGYWRLHKKMMATESTHRWEGLVKIVLCPPASVRALDLISLDLLDLYHPLAVAGVVTGKSELQRLAVAMVREARHSLPVDLSVSGLAEVADWHRRTMLEAAETFLKKEQVDLSAVDQVPNRTDESVKSYCPRCLTVYMIENGDCSDCRGLALVPLKREGK